MYTYIVERTQIYLSQEQAARLDREAKRTGTTRSHLIREAIEARHGAAKDPKRIKRVLRTTAGVWRDRVETGEQYVESIRTGRRLQELYPEGEPESPDR
jgi:predicted DNA-binding protein